MDSTVDMVATVGSGSWWSRLLARFGASGRRTAVNRIDLETACPELLRDIGLRDGRGPSLRRPERVF